MSISSLVVHVRGEKKDSVQAELNRIDGVEIHGASEDGRLVVTVDQLNDQDAANCFATIRNLDGVLNTSLVYNYFENSHRNVSDREG
jgi:nitrate reductase NapD